MVITPAKGKDFRDTKVLDGMASPSAAFKAKNETTQYKTSGSKNSSGSMGGKNTNS